MSASYTDLARVEGAGGVVWSVSPEGFHTNLVVLGAGDRIPAHRNDALDVLIVGLAGAGTVAVDDDAVHLAPGGALLVRRGARRSISAGERGLRYLTIHAERGPLVVGSRAQHEASYPPPPTPRSPNPGGMP